MPRRPTRAPEIVDVFSPPPADQCVPDAVSVPALAAAAPEMVAVPPVRPVPESQLNPEQRRIRDLENQLALERGRKDPEPELEPVAPGTAGVIRIHFVADGFTALGSVWYRGQELEFAPGSRAWADTCDRFGRSWLDLRDSPAAQEERFGEVKFRSGPWPGKTYRDASTARFDGLTPLKEGQRLIPDEAELAKAEQAEQRRRRAAPRLPVH